jgi:DNA-binding NtrC family response regulator
VRATSQADDPAESTLTETREGGAAKAPKVLAPHLFIVLDCDHPKSGASRHSLANIDRVLLGRGSDRRSERLFEDGQRVLALRIPNPRASSRHAHLVRQGEGFILVDLGSHNGTRLNGVRVTGPTPVSDGDLVQLGHTILLYRAATEIPLGQPADVDSARDAATPLLATMLPSVAPAAEALARVARSSSPVLLLGETGTGKEVLARAIHRASGRRGPFAAVNCGALPATLVEAQLFGHARGAFSGAVDAAPGLIRSAEGGTLLLDEVGDLPAPAQAALLRVLQEQEVTAIGTNRPVKVDFRLLAATHRPVETLSKSGEFRTDLFARLAGFTFHLPPLRKRVEDLALILAAAVGESPFRLRPAAARALFRYDWPLNVRELCQALKVAIALSADGEIDLGHLPPHIAAHASPTRRIAPLAAIDDPVRQKLLASLARHRGNVTAVASELGTARMQVHRWLRRWRIDAASFRLTK